MGVVEPDEPPEDSADACAAAALKPLSLRAYARRRGVSPEAVSKAVADGRLTESVTRAYGAPKIADPELADREWEANTRPRTDGSTPSTPSSGASGYHESRAIREAADARRAIAQADLADLELLERRRQLVDAERARSDVIRAFSLVKTKLLAVPTRVGQRFPHLIEDVIPFVEQMIREALEELAGDDGGAGG
jgi:hypothetical protein